MIQLPTGRPVLDDMVKEGLKPGELRMPPFGVQRRSAWTWFRFMPVPGTNLVADTETERRAVSIGRQLGKAALTQTLVGMYGLRYDPMEEAPHRDIWKWAGFFFMMGSHDPASR